MKSDFGLKNCFNDIQKCKSAQFSSYIKDCASNIINNNIPIVDFQHILSVILLSKSKKIPTKITLFLKKTIEEVNFHENTEPFLKSVSDHLLKTIISKNKKVRSNTIFLLHLLSQELNVNDDMIISVGERLFDKDKIVRKEAVRFLSRYQERHVDEKTAIYHLFKDLLRHDPSHEVRKEVLGVIILNKTTINSVVERLADSDLGVRKHFYEQILEKIKLKKLKKEGFEFLVNKIFVERELDFKSNLVDKIIEDFEIKDNIHSFFMDFTFDCSKELLFLIYEKVEIQIKNFPTTSSESMCLKYQLEFRESKYGRDSLNLPDLVSYSEHIYTICTKTQEKEDNLMKDLFSILNFYDIFNEESKKILKCTIYKLLSTRVAETIIEESVIILNNICNDKNLIGGILKVNMENNANQALIIAKYVMKHLFPFDELHSAIIDWVLTNFNEGDHFYKTLFFYELYKEEDRVMNALCNCNDLNLLVDLYITKDDVRIKDKVEEIILREMDKENIEIITPLSKLILASKVSGEVYISFLLQKYYDFNCSEDNKQYLTVFFNELFNRDPSSLINSFCSVLINIENKKSMIGQSIFWISNSSKRNGLQELFFKICIFILKDDMITKSDTLVDVLTRIEICDSWDPLISKKILYCSSLISENSEADSFFCDIIPYLKNIVDEIPLEKEIIDGINIDIGKEQ